MQSPIHNRFSGPRRLWHSQCNGFVVLILSVLVIGYLSLLNMQQGFREYRRLSLVVMPVTAALQDLRFSSLRMVSSASEFGLIARLEGVADGEKAAAMEQEVREFNRGLEIFSRTLAEYRKQGQYLYSVDGEEIERVFLEGSRMKYQARTLLAASRDGAGAGELFELKEELEQTEQQFLERVSQRLEHQAREVETRQAVISRALERQFWVLALGSLFLLALALLQRSRGERICRACADRPNPGQEGPEEPGPQVMLPKP